MSEAQDPGKCKPLHFPWDASAPDRPAGQEPMSFEEYLDFLTNFEPTEAELREVQVYSEPFRLPPDT